MTLNFHFRNLIYKNLNPVFQYKITIRISVCILWIHQEYLALQKLIFYMSHMKCNFFIIFWKLQLFLINCVDLWYTKGKQKIFYNRSTNSAAFCELLNVLTTLFPFMQLLTLFLLQVSQPINIKGWDFSQSYNPYAVNVLLI